MKQEKNNTSYNQILKSTTIFGGSQVITILIGLVRTKIIAILLGTVGIGIIGIFQSVIDMMRSTLSLGMDTAGVREIAETENKEDKIALNKTISRFSLWFRSTASLALLICIILCYPISNWAFGNGDYALHIAGLSVSIFLVIITTGRSSILQGLRKIPEMAKSSIWGSLFGLIITIPIYYIWGINGIIPAFISGSLISFISVEYYYRKQGIQKVKIPIEEAFSTGLNTLKLGLYIVVAGVIGTVSMFLIRAFITKNIDIDATGLFQASWMITNVYLGLILRSMGSDFFPRLSAIADDRKGIRTLVNEQSYIVLIIATPAIIGMLIFSGFILKGLYSSEFVFAETILRWQILGTFFKVISWPIAFIMLAKNRGAIFLATEFIFYATYLLFAYLLYPQYGIDASGIGYFVAYIIYFPLVFWAGYRISGFHWDKNILIMTLINLALICFTFFAIYSQPDNLWWGIGILIISLLYSYYKLKQVFSLEDFKNWITKK